MFDSKTMQAINTTSALLPLWRIVNMGIYPLAVLIVSVLPAALIALAQAPSAPPVDPLTNGYGWAGAGLLGLVLAWLLLKHVPDKDKQIRDLVNDYFSLLGAKDKSHAKIIEDKDTAAALATREARTEFRAMLLEVVAMHEKQLNGFAALIHKDNEAISRLIEQMKETVDKLQMADEDE